MNDSSLAFKKILNLINRCQGDSFTEAAMKAGGGFVFGAVAGYLTAWVCLSGVETPYCIAFGASSVIGAAEYGEKFGGGAYDWFN